MVILFLYKPKVDKVKLAAYFYFKLDAAHEWKHMWLANMQNWTRN